MLPQPSQLYWAPTTIKHFPWHLPVRIITKPRDRTNKPNIYAEHIEEPHDWAVAHPSRDCRAAGDGLSGRYPYQVHDGFAVRRCNRLCAWPDRHVTKCGHVGDPCDCCIPAWSSRSQSP